MTKSAFTTILILVIVAVVVGIDLLFFRNNFWARFTANLGIVLVFMAVYFWFSR